MAFNPKTGLVYIPAQELTFPYIPEKDFKPAPMGFNLGLDLAAGSLPPGARGQASGDRGG